MRTACSVVVSVLALSAGLALAEEPAPPPQPTAEHRELAQWLGSWTGTGDMKPGPFGPGGRMTWTEECSWLGGAGFHVVCTSEGESPMGPMKGIGIIGYDVNKKVYTHYGVDSTGWAGFSEGTRSGDGWTFTSQERMGDTVYHTRFTMTQTAPNRMSFSWEMSEDGTEWTVLMVGATVRK